MVTRWCPLGVVIGTTLALYGGTLFGDEAFFARDVFLYYWPMREGWLESVRASGIPHWSAVSQSGLPLLGDIHASPLYPLNAVYFLLSFPRGYALQIFLHHIAGGLGMLALLSRLRLGAPAATAGSVVWMLCGYTVALGNAGPLMAGAAYLPWSLFLIAGQGRIWRRAGLLGVVLALQALTGDPQAVLLSIIACAVWLGWHGFQREPLVVAFGGTALSALLAAGQLIPAWEVLKQSTRAAASSRFAEEFAFHPTRLLELFAPRPFGEFGDSPPFWATFLVTGPGDWPFALSAYLGASALVIGVLAARTSRLTWIAATMLVLGLGLSMAGFLGLDLLLTNVPPFRFFRYPEKYLLLCAVGASLLAAAGVSGLSRAPHGRALNGRLITGFVVGAVVVCSGLLSSIVASWWLQAVDRHIETLAPVASASLGRALFHGGAFILAGAVVVLLARVLPAARRTAAWGGVGIIAVDLFVASSPLVMTAPIDLYRLRPPLVDALRTNSPVWPSRVIRDAYFRQTGTLDSSGAYTQRAGWELATLRSNLGGGFGIQDMAGYSGGFSLDRWEKVAVALHREKARLGGIFNGCAAITSPRRAGKVPYEEFSLAQVDKATGAALLTNSRCMPRIYSVPKVEGVEDIAGALSRLGESSFDPRTTAVAEGSPTLELAQAEVELLTSSPNRISARVITPGPTFVVHATSWFPGWTARVDGAEVPLLNVNGATMGAHVPEGEHVVTMEFQHPGRWALLISLLSVALAAWMICTKRNRIERRRVEDLGA